MNGIRRRRSPSIRVAFRPFRSALAAVAVAGLVMAMTGCIPPRPTPSPPTAAPSPSEAPATPTPVGSLVSPTGVVVDPSLLEVLPPGIDGVPLTPDLDSAEAIAADASVAPFVAGIAVAVAFGPIPSDDAGDAGDYVVVTVARLKPGLFGDLFFRGWRDTFDAAVCEQAGGVGGHAEAEIAGHQTFIGTCAGGLRTYHVHLPSSDIIVSMQSVGEGRFGERVVAGLTE